MDTLLHRFKDKIKGTIEGFDRIIFKGMLKPICYQEGMQAFIRNRGVLNKNYKEWIIDRSSSVIKSAEEYTINQCGVGIQYIPSCNTRKEEMAHDRQKKSGIKEGLIGTFSCVESCRTFKAVYDSKAGFPQIRNENSRCKHLYFYYDHKELGFMSIRLQTWAPFEIQIALNGREWLRRRLEKEKIRFIIDGNKFLHISDYEAAQRLLYHQLSTRWEDLLTSFLPDVFPLLPSLTNEDFNYTWILWQSEWAKDYIFSDPQALDPHIGHLLRYAFNTGTSDRVLRYMGHPVRKDGQPFREADPELVSRVNLWYDGARIRHWVGKNSVKMYNEQNVLRFEMTMNDPAKYHIHRNIEGRLNEEKKFLPMRKGIADIGVRAKISSDRLRCFTEHMATVTEADVTVSELISKIDKPVISNGKKYRALEITGKDLDLLKAVSDPKYSVDAITNKHIRNILAGTAWANGLTDKKLSARISRNLRLLREHGLIKKMPKQHKYMLTDKGRLLTTALNQFLCASIDDLAKIAA